jgi:tetratricopeptide (TPR) repeat protein
MWALHSALQASGVGLITGAVSSIAQVRGLGGIGKSLFAEEYALRFGAAYAGGVFWLRGYGHGEGTLDPVQREAERERQIEAFAARVGIGVAELSRGEVEGALGGWIAAQAERARPCLWVVDDLAPGLDGELSRWLAPHPAAKTLITTRSREYEALGRHTDLATLPEGEALELLTKRRQPRGEAERAAAAAIAAELGRHPLALDVAAAALRFQSFASFLGALTEADGDSLERLTAELRDVLPNGHERSIARTLSESIDRLGDQGMDFLRLAAVLAAAPVSADLIAAVFATVDSDRRAQPARARWLRRRRHARGLDQRRAAERQVQAIDQVMALSLAEGAGELAWSVHALVARTVRFTDRTPGRREALRQAALTTLTGELEAIVDFGLHARLGGLVPHARELTRRAEDVGELALLGWVARYDRERGDYASARALWQRHYETHRRVLGDEHPDTLASLNGLAATLWAQGDLAGARTLHEQALELRRRVLGDEHPDTLNSLNNLAATLRDQGDLAGARTLDEQALELRRRVLGDEHPDTLKSLSNVAVTLRDQGDLAGARTLHEQALELRRRVLGDEHPDTLTSLSNVAVTLRAQGDLAGARTLHEQALELRRRVLGDEHPDTLTSLSNVAVTLRAQGDLAGARRLHEQALELRRRVLGDEHRDTMNSLSNLAETLRAQGDPAGARSVEGFRRSG